MTDPIPASDATTAAPRTARRRGGRQAARSARVGGRAGVLVVVAVALAVAGSPALADPAVPTHFRSTVTGVTTPDGDEVGPPFATEILGGDAFLVVRVEQGATLEVPGYEGEPYVRVHADGLVEINDRSPARWLNDERYGASAAEIPDVADAQAPPDWRAVAHDGEYAWHDHRIHFMSPRLPRDVDPTVREPQHVFDWEVELVVDGEPMTLHGTLEWVPGPRPVLPVALLALGLVAAALAGWRLPPLPLVLVGAFAAGAVGVAGRIGLPPGADADVALVALPAVAIVLAAVGRRRLELVTAAGGLPLVGWVLVLAGALVRPIVPGAAPAGVVRATVVVVLATAVATIVAGVRALTDAAPVASRSRFDDVD